MSQTGAAIASAAAAAGRSEHGTERRAAILAATVRLLTRDGLAAVTHRAVAKEAGVPLAATTYYFASKDELVTEALQTLVAEEIELLMRTASDLAARAGSPAELSAAIQDALIPRTEAERRVLMVKFEAYLEAARRPALRAAVGEWLDTFVGLAEGALTLAGAPEPKVSAPLLIAGLDGLLVRSLGRGLEAGPDEELPKRIDALVQALVSAPENR